MKTPRATIYKNDCMDTWSYNGQVYSRCTTVADPEGNTEREWCKIGKMGVENKDWELCDDELDFDSIRSNVVI